MLEQFNMSKTTISSFLSNHFKLSNKQSSSTDKDMEDMSKITYASTIESLMYIMLCIRHDITHAIEVVSCFMSNP